jgi:predicted nucleic acid-binding Zn ribbon protein
MVFPGRELYRCVPMIPANQVIPAVLSDILRKAPLTPEKVAFAWRTAVGPAVDKATSLDLRNGVLFVLAKDAVWQREVERSAAMIRSRLADLLGTDVVRFIKVTRP